MNSDFNVAAAYFYKDGDDKYTITLQELLFSLRKDKPTNFVQLQRAQITQSDSVY